MRLLYFRDDGSLAFTEFGRHNIPQYAILSHTWGDQEVTLQDLIHGSTINNHDGYQKIIFCGDQAAKDGLRYFWVDTCCIDKRNLPEITEAINTMFRWYRSAVECYVYLSDVSVSSMKGTIDSNECSWMEDFRRSRWFTRGWTLQELIAPTSVQFFSTEGVLLGNRSSLIVEITSITGIPKQAMGGQLGDFSSAERFAWAANRETTKEEDIAYCLLGIFDVFIPLLYGEGDINALKRLKRAVDDSLNDKLLGGIEYSDSHWNEDTSVPGTSVGPLTLKHSLQPSDNEGKKRRTAYALKALGTTTALISKGQLGHGKLFITVLSPWHQALFLSRNVAEGANAGLIFQEAQVSFLNAVYWDEWPHFVTFADRSGMMADLRSNCENLKHSTRLHSACKHIDAFCLQLTHFFTLVESAINIDPEWPRMMWGAIRLVFARCQTFVNMFEKLAQMLDEMRKHLPSYHDHIFRLHEDCPEALRSDIARALAFVYVDVLHFCHDVCVLFKKPPELDLVPDPIRDLLSTSFNLRFGNIIDRFSEHKGLFDVDLRAGRHQSLRTFITKVAQHLTEREKVSQNEEMVLSLKRERLSRDRAFRARIGYWIQPPDFKEDFEKAYNLRRPYSCSWLPFEPSYISWKHAVQIAESEPGYRDDSSVHPHEPILWLEGPPGFGKTVLSTVAIEDLISTVPNAASAGQSRSVVAYFYFNAQIPGKRAYCDALRSITVQVIDEFGNEPGMIDLISILMARDKDTWLKASDDDMVELLLLLLRRLSTLTIILDGIDECGDFEKIWIFLSAACAHGNIKCIFFGRPLVLTPSEHTHLVLRQPLVGMNRQDISNYLRQEIRSLQLTGHLEESLMPDLIADSLTSRASSRFLWASLIISYLKSPLLDPEERAREIENSSQLETLHRLYTGMLRQFESLFAEEKTLMTKIFQFLVLSEQPLSVEQLNIAISIVPGSKVSEDRSHNVQDNFGKLSGDLINIDSNSIVSFSHLSFRIFLMSGEAEQLNTPFRVDIKAGSLRIAVVCLSYLVNDIPPSPLGVSPETPSFKAVIASRLPLSRYAVQYWVQHAVRALQLMPGTVHELVSECYSLLQQLGSFISRKASISAWIEICWTYDLKPSIEPLWKELSRRLEQVNAKVQKSSMEARMSQALDQIRTLSEDLMKINEHWSHVLSVRPYEIWGASISAFLGQMSWAHNDEINIIPISNQDVKKDAEDIILKVSKLSVCGNFLGIITLFRSSTPRSSDTVKPCTCSLVQCTCSHAESLIDLRDSMVSYQILELKTGFPIVKEFTFSLSPEDLREVERKAEGRDFQFPIAFSFNLQCVSILRTIFWIEQDGTLQQQSINEPLPSLIRQRRPRPQRLQELNRLESESSQGTEGLRPKYYRLKFSPCGQYVVHIERQIDNNESSKGYWNFSIWQKEPSDSLGGQKSTWKRIAALYDIYGDYLHDGNVEFHHKFRVLALMEMGSYASNFTSIWKFSKLFKGRRRPKTIMVYGTGLRNLHFSPCGQFLCGDHFYYGTVRMVRLETYLKDAHPLPDLGWKEDHSFRDVEMLNDYEAEMEGATQAVLTQLVSVEDRHRGIQSSNTLTLNASNGLPELNTVRSYADGAVVLKRLSSLVNEEKCLLYLPNHTSTCTSVSVLSDSEGRSHDVRMVLTTDLQGSYTLDNPQNIQSANMVTRPSQSIRSYEPLIYHSLHSSVCEIGELSNIPDAKTQELF